MTKELWQCTATELANLIASKEASSSEVIDAHLNRIGEVNGHLNAVTKVLEEEARADAANADAAVMAGDELGPFHGVPFTIKENIDVAFLGAWNFKDEIFKKEKLFKKKGGKFLTHVPKVRLI